MTSRDEMEDSFSEMFDDNAHLPDAALAAAADAWLEPFTEAALAASVEELSVWELEPVPEDLSEIFDWLGEVEDLLDEASSCLPWDITLALSRKEGPRFSIERDEKPLRGPKMSALAARIGASLKIPYRAFDMLAARVKERGLPRQKLRFIDLSGLLDAEPGEDDPEDSLTGPRPDVSASPWDKLQWLAENRHLVPGAEEEIEAIFVEQIPSLVPSDPEPVGGPDEALWPNQPHRIKKPAWGEWLRRVDEVLDTCNGELWQTGIALLIAFDQTQARYGPRFVLMDEMDREIESDAARLLGEAICGASKIPFDAMHAVMALFGDNLFALTRRCSYFTVVSGK